MSDNSTDLQAIQNNVIDLKQFPPKLRKLAKFMLQNDEHLTLKECCKECDLNIDSIYTMIDRSKRKGNDFRQFIHDKMTSVLQNNKLNVANSLVDGAVKGVVASQKLFYELTGDLKKEVDININETLTIGINTLDGSGKPMRPKDIADRPKGVIDTEVIIPKDKGISPK